MSDIHAHKILILDFGSQTTQLIARRIREAGVYCEIHPFNKDIEFIKGFRPKGIVLSGGPSSVYDKDAPFTSVQLFDLGLAILGICYGMQLTTHLLGGKVERSSHREYGHAKLAIERQDPFFDSLVLSPETHQVWMSHGDRIEGLAPGFVAIASSPNSPVAAMRHESLPIYGVQFHPEVAHTEIGVQLLQNFLFKVAGCEPSWNMHSFVETTSDEIRRRVGQRHVICALSGGVDSTVTALMINKAIGRQLTCVFVNNGLLRKNEPETVQNFLGRLGLNLCYVDATERFLTKLDGIADPEKKRRIIGEEFIKIFEEEAHKVGNVDFLAQGTLYPDVIESVSFKGPSAVIKSHHNVGGLPAVMKLELIEPLRELFKDEVRVVAKELGMPDELIWRHPFPGPGLAIRILGDVTQKRLEIVKEADAIMLEEFKSSGWYGKVWQAFAVLLPVRSVGVMGDERTYDYTIALRAVNSLDAMTADWARLPHELLARISSRIINEVRGVNRVVYDISSKPPATIEWE